MIDTPHLRKHPVNRAILRAKGIRSGFAAKLPGIRPARRRVARARCADCGVPLPFGWSLTHALCAPCTPQDAA